MYLLDLASTRYPDGNASTLLLSRFSTDEGPIVRYNQSKYRRPIARGDFILAVR